MQCKIVTPDKLVFEGDVDSVILPGIEGSFGVLENHAPLATILREGQIEIESTQEAKDFSVTGGFVEIRNNKILVFADQIKQ